MSDIEDYQNLVTSEHAGQPNFNAMIGVDVSTQVQVQALFQEMLTLFNLSTPPVGNQLDIIGQWVGVSRNVSIPITGVFFSWDSTVTLGWDSGIWQNPGASTITSLPDSVYLTLILATIASNNWNGIIEGAYAIWAILFPNLNLLIQDNQDMTMVVALQGYPLDALTLALLEGGYLALKPEGVEILEYIVPSDTNPLFGWDLDNAYVQGWDTGSWGIELAGT
jgi:hypothetical protein